MPRSLVALPTNAGSIYFTLPRPARFGSATGYRPERTGDSSLGKKGVETTANEFDIQRTVHRDIVL